jgi:hypothetical protein
MLVMFILMNTGSATAAIHVMVDVIHGQRQRQVNEDQSLARDSSSLC